MKIIFLFKGRLQEVLGPMTISSVLENSGYSTAFIDIDRELKLLETIILQNKQNCILAYSLPTIFSGLFLNLNRTIKHRFPGVISFFGGAHPTFFPEMIEEEGVDGVCIGEGEYAMLDLIRELEAGSEICGIENWWIKKAGRIYKNPLRPLVDNLDALPFADRSNSRNFILFKQGAASIMTSRGCPYQCSFCFNHAYNRLYGNLSGKVRRRSVPNVIEEIMQLKKQFRIKHIIFMDDVFISDREWLGEFHKEYKKNVKLPFHCHVRADLASGEIISLLKDAGCSRINMGIECADADYRNRALRKGISTEAIIRAAGIIKREGIYLRTTNMLGCPGTSLDNDIETLRLNIQCRVDYARANIFSAYPKLDIYPFAKKSGIIRDSLELASLGGEMHLERRYENNRDKRKLENLALLFSLIVSSPFIFSFCRFLIKMPLTRLYSYLNRLFFIFQTYSYRFKITAVKKGPRKAAIRIFIKSSDCCPRRNLDASRIISYFQANHCVITRSPKNADFIIFITCAFEKSQEERSFYLIKEFKKHKAELVITGCLPGTAPTRLQREFSGRTLLINEINKIDNFFPHFKVKFQDTPDANLPFINTDFITVKYLLKRLLGEFRLSGDFLGRCLNSIKDIAKPWQAKGSDSAVLRISSGCLRECSYCAVRFATGRLRSKPLDTCLEEYKKLLDQNKRHIEIIGEEIGSYGLDTGSSLPELLSKLSEVDRGLDVKWSLLNLNPEWAICYKDKILGLIKKGKIKKIKCDIQSGNGRILKLMNRYHDAGKILETYAEFKKTDPELLIFSTFIVGFPQETEAEFNDTVNIMQQLKLDEILIIPYSDMEGTCSSRMQGKVAEELIRQRLKYCKDYFRKEHYKVSLDGHFIFLVR